MSQIKGGEASAFMNSKIAQLESEVGRNATRSSVGPSGGRRGSTDAMQSQKVKSLQERVSTLEGDLDRRMRSYMDRERKFKDRISRLESELNSIKEGKRKWLNADDRMARLRNMHSDVLGNIEHVQTATTRVLQEQERDLLRAFRARLFDVQTDLEREKSKSDDGAAVHIERNRQLMKDLDWAKEMAERLERLTESLQKDNARLKTQYKSQSDDREYVIQQLVLVKKDNARLREENQTISNGNKKLMQELEMLKEEVKHPGGRSVGMSNPAFARSSPSLSIVAGGGLSSGMSGRSGLRSAGGFGQGGEADGEVSKTAEGRYKEIIRRMKVMLEKERKAHRATRQHYTRELNSRTELEKFLRESVEDVRAEIKRRRTKLMSTVGPRSLSRPGSGAGGLGQGEAKLDAFSAADRERVMELLLSQERVINLLYSKTFPRNRGPGSGSRPASSKARLGLDTMGGRVSSPLSSSRPASANVSAIYKSVYSSLPSAGGAGDSGAASPLTLGTTVNEIPEL